MHHMRLRTLRSMLTRPSGTPVSDPWFRNHRGAGALWSYCLMGSLPTDDAVRAAARLLRVGLTAAGLDRAIAAYFSEPGFAGMTFSDLGRNPPGEIIADDLLAVSLLDITWRPQAVRILLGSRRQQLSQMLAAIPQEADLWDADDDTLRRRIDTVGCPDWLCQPQLDPDPFKSATARARRPDALASPLRDRAACESPACRVAFPTDVLPGFLPRGPLVMVDAGHGSRPVGTAAAGDRAWRRGGRAVQLLRALRPLGHLDRPDASVTWLAIPALTARSGVPACAATARSLFPASQARQRFTNLDH